jgi:hypothetical protein
MLEEKKGSGQHEGAWAGSRALCNNSLVELVDKGRLYDLGLVHGSSSNCGSGHGRRIRGGQLVGRLSAGLLVGRVAALAVGALAGAAGGRRVGWGGDVHWVAWRRGGRRRLDGWGGRLPEYGTGSGAHHMVRGLASNRRTLNSSGHSVCGARKSGISAAVRARRGSLDEGEGLERQAIRRLKEKRGQGESGERKRERC